MSLGNVFFSFYTPAPSPRKQIVASPFLSFYIFLVGSESYLNCGVDWETRGLKPTEGVICDE